MDNIFNITELEITNLEVSHVSFDDIELKQRKLEWVEPTPKYKSGVLWKYAKLVSSASEGAVTD